LDFFSINFVTNQDGKRENNEGDDDDYVNQGDDYKGDEERRRQELAGNYVSETHVTSEELGLIKRLVIQSPCKLNNRPKAAFSNAV
jgi:hypothetical protein